MCKRYETELGIILAEEDPVDSVNELSKQVKNTILDPNNHATLPDDSDSRVRAESDALAQKLIADHKPTWRLPPEQRQM